MKCENCSNDHDGTFGSGRFCSRKCSSAFSTKSKRTEINSKVSASMKGKPSPKVGKPNPWSDEAKEKAKLRSLNESWKTVPWDQLAKSRYRERILHEQNGVCDVCKNPPMWMNKPLKFQLDHISGDHSDNSRENLRLLCPNCHFQTPTWGARNASDEGKKKIREALIRGTKNRVKD